MSMKNVMQIGALLIAGVWLVGCGQPADKAARRSAAASNESKDKHDGWWCDEHGVPEGVCTRCDPKLVAEFKAKGDWCKQHDRPDSQCFICHPEKEAEVTADYEARYGKKPPKPTDG